MWFADVASQTYPFTMFMGAVVTWKISILIFWIFPVFDMFKFNLISEIVPMLMLQRQSLMFSCRSFFGFAFHIRPVKLLCGWWGSNLSLSIESLSFPNHYHPVHLSPVSCLQHLCQVRCPLLGSWSITIVCLFVPAPTLYCSGDYHCVITTVIFIALLSLDFW